MSPIINVGIVPFSFSIKFPSYLPVPSCNLTSSDIAYDFTVKDSAGNLARSDWYKYVSKD